MKKYSVAADNECLFNAIAFGIIASKKSINIAKISYKELAKKLRKITACIYENKLASSRFIEKLANEYIILRDIKSDVSSNVSKSKQLEYAQNYIRDIKKPDTWGGHLEIIVLGEYIHKLGFKGIKVYDENLNIINGYHSKFKYKNKYPYIKLILSGISVGGCHFNYLH